MSTSSLNKYLINYKNIKENEPWIYSAGFNINKNYKNFSRIDEEIFDLKNLIKRNCQIFLLTHQGDFKKTSIHLNF